MQQEIIQLPASVIYDLIKKVDSIYKATKVNNLITEEEAAIVLEMKNTRSVYNAVKSGVIPKDCYTVMPTGKRKYYRDKLLGIK